jgi:PAS domain S-box-containing protein
MRAEDAVAAAAPGELIASLIDGARHHALIATDPAGAIAYWSVGAARIYGKSADEMCGQPVAVLDAPTSTAPTSDCIAHAAVAGTWEGRALHRRGDGTTFTAEVTWSVRRNGAGDFAGYAMVARDVGEVDRAVVAQQRAEAKFRALLEAAPDAIVIVDRSGTIVLVNALTERMFGYPRAELLGQPVELLLPDRLRERHGAHRRGFTASPRARAMGSGLQLSGRRRDGSEFPIEISLSPLETDEGMLVSSAIRDISDRKKARRSSAGCSRPRPTPWSSSTPAAASSWSTPRPSGCSATAASSSSASSSRCWCRSATAAGTPPSATATSGRRGRARWAPASTCTGCARTAPSSPPRSA